MLRMRANAARCACESSQLHIGPIGMHRDLAGKSSRDEAPGAGERLGQDSRTPARPLHRRHSLQREEWIIRQPPVLRPTWPMRLGSLSLWKKNKSPGR